MSQAAQLIDLLKKALRERGETYASIARGLRLSESTVKRLFSRKRMSLERLEQVCSHLELSIADLLEVSRAKEARVRELTEAQEQMLVDDPRLLLVGLLVLSHWPAAQILETYRLTEAELVKHLTRLDALGIIDLLPGNRVKLRLARDFAWRRGGPLQRFFESHVQDEYFDSSFRGPGELRVVLHGSLSEHSNALLQSRMKKLAEEFDDLVNEDRRLAREKLLGTTLVLAMRPWELGIVTKLRRKPGTDPNLG